MSNLEATISGFVAGDDLEVRRTVTDLPGAMTAAWFSVKHYPAEPDGEALIQKKITTTDVAGTGQIEEAGPTPDGVLRFDLTPADTRSLGTKALVYDIQILAGSKVYTLERGSIQLTSDVTQTTT